MEEECALQEDQWISKISTKKSVHCESCMYLLIIFSKNYRKTKCESIRGVDTDYPWNRIVHLIWYLILTKWWQLSSFCLRVWQSSGVSELRAVKCLSVRLAQVPFDRSSLRLGFVTPLLLIRKLVYLFEHCRLENPITASHLWDILNFLVQNNLGACFHGPGPPSVSWVSFTMGSDSREKLNIYFGGQGR